MSNIKLFIVAAMLASVGVSALAQPSHQQHRRHHDRHRHHHHHVVRR